MAQIILTFEGPKHGYNNEASKMILIVAPQFVEQAKIDFQEFGVEVLTGHRILGGFVGSPEDKSDWLKKKTNTGFIPLSSFHMLPKKILMLHLLHCQSHFKMNGALYKELFKETMTHFFH